MEMKANKGVLGIIGNTPVVKLEKLFPSYDIDFFAKLESLNPGGSAKDRSAYSMLFYAKKEGLINDNTINIRKFGDSLGSGLQSLESKAYMRY